MIFNEIAVELYVSGSWINIKNDIVSSNGIQLTPRIDGTFTVGYVDVFSTRQYIPPYTPLRITLNNNTIYLVCNPKTKKYLLENNRYYHTLELFEATAILSNFIVGSKAFSVTGTNTLDIDKLNILIELVNKKYNVNISKSTVTLDKEREFTFGAGTTLYDAITAIVSEYNLVPIVDIVTSPTNIHISFVDKDETSNISYINGNGETSYDHIYNNEITDLSYGQNMDNYCKYLETEAQNVIDRTTTTVWKNLTVRSEEAKLNDDTACIVLPNKVEEITSIKVDKLKARININLVNNGSINIEDIAYDDPGFVKSSFDKILYYLADKSGVFDEDYDFETEKKQTKLYQILALLFGRLFDINVENYQALIDKVDSYLHSVVGGNSGWEFQSFQGYYMFILNDVPFYDVILTPYILEKKKWDILETKDKPKYMYYESGTNVIKGLYNFYKDDFWGTLAGLKVDPYYKSLNYYTQEITGDANYGSISVEEFGSVNLNVLFDVEAKCITNPLMINEKTLPSISESSWKPYARSYNVKESLIEFDKLEERMQLTNDMLGDIELELEVTNPTFIPNLIGSTYKLTYDNTSYYVMAFVISIRLDMMVIKYSLSRKYSKKAEVIGVDSQFEATPNPLTNVITRPIFINNVNNEAKNVDLDEYYLLKFLFYRNSVDDDPIVLFKRYTLLEKAGHKYLYCEMVNQYSADYETVKINDITADYINNPVPYVDEFNEIYAVDIALAKPDDGYLKRNDLLLDFSKQLPIVNAEPVRVPYKKYLTRPELSTDKRNIVLHKDAREHLTFTIKLN